MGRPRRPDGKNAAAEATKTYQKKTYNRLTVVIKKDDGEKLRAYAAARGESVNGLINRLLALEVPGFDGIGTNND